MDTTRATLAIYVYRAAANLIAPIAYRRVAEKLRAQGVPETRLKERAGKATKPRPTGALLWFHAASVGESVSVLRLIEQLGQTHQDLNFLITSGTATSAEVLAKRMPPRCIHQFAPLDSANAMGRFLAHWNPAAAVFVESELWPQMLSRTAELHVPMALINARISENSAKNWSRFKKTARHLMSHFCMIHCQDTRTEEHLRRLGLDHAEKGVNLKSLSGPLPFESDRLHELRKTLGDRPIWLAASTHPSEEEIVLAVQRTLIEHTPETLLILVPRHPERADEIEAVIKSEGLGASLRSQSDVLTEQTQVYLADTLGEMGLWYTLSPLTVLCGSFSDVGGHNPYEPAYAGSAVLHGPNYANFAHTYAELDEAGGGLQTSDERSLAQELGRLLASQEDLAAMQANARAFASRQDHGLESFAEALSNALSLR